MGCLTSKSNASFMTSNDDEVLLEEKNTDLQYDFVAEYNTIDIDCNIANKQTVSRRPSISICIGNITESKNENNTVFIKQYFKSDEWNSLSFRREAKILSKISHNNITKYISSYEDSESYYLCIEYCTNGTLISYIYNNYKFGKFEYNQILIYKIISTLISITSYIHKLNIVHRNICLENILIDNNGLYKLIAWDDAEIIQNKNDVYNDVVGSNIYYLSPETAQIRHGWELKKIDMFAIGVCAFILSFGSVPFTGTHHTHIVKKIKTYKYNYPNSEINISNEFKHFIKALLSPFSFSRISANDAKYQLSIISKSLTNISFSNIPFKLYCYQSSMKIKKLLIQHECDTWTNFEQNQLIKVFENIFNLQKQQINCIDLENLLIKMGLNKQESQKKTKQLFLIMDPKETGLIKIKSLHANKISNKIPIHSNSTKHFEYTPIINSNNQTNDENNEPSYSQSSVSEIV
eukprot:313008_1